MASWSDFAVVQTMMSMPQIDLFDLVIVDFREHQVLLQAHGVVATAVEALAVQTTEVLHARQRDRDQAVEEFVHTVLAQGDLGADHHAFAQLEAGDRLAGLGGDGLLAGDRLQVLQGGLSLLGVSHSFADTHVQDDLVQLGDLHLVGVAELLLHRGADALAINGLQPGLVSLISH